MLRRLQHSNLTNFDYQVRFLPSPISNLKLERKQNLGCELLPGLDEELFNGFKNTAIVS